MMELYAAERAAYLFENDRRFRAATPRLEILEAARQPGLRLSQVLRTLAEGYSDRPALGSRVVATVRDKETGRTVPQLLPALRSLPGPQRQYSVLPLLTAYSQPDKPVLGSQAPAEAFRKAVQQNKIGTEHDIPICPDN